MSDDPTMASMTSRSGEGLPSTLRGLDPAASLALAVDRMLGESRARVRVLEEALRKAVCAAEWAFAKMDRGDGVLEYTGTIQEGDDAERDVREARAVLGGEMTRCGHSGGPRGEDA